MDDGPGVPAARSHTACSRRSSARDEPTETGLGLSLAFGIVTSHGGTLELMPTDRGACFRLTLPGAAGTVRETGSTVH